ncbi:MAG: ornithine cyclodeaminase family protein [Acidimicrobiaceae bacterium]|nr:ornithine cyclodeaminase family protein [Acidimicrobiaceae bacterium]
MNKVLILNQADVIDLLPMGACIEAVEESFLAHARNDVIQPLRPFIKIPEDAGILAMMPGYVGPLEAAGIKVITVYYTNHGTEYDSHQGVVMLFDTINGRLLTVADASSITAIRTAAASGVATRLLSNEASSSLTIIGSGTQARTHVEAMLAVRPIQTIRVWGRNPDTAAEFAGWARRTFDVPARFVEDIRGALSGADIVCTTTSSNDPLVLEDMLEPGMHINAVGSSVKFARELDAGAMKRCRLYVDSRESALNESGDLILAMREGIINDKHIVAEIGEVLDGQRPGRGATDEITLFDSLGLAIQDISAARLIYDRAIADSRGTMVELGGARVPLDGPDPAR